MDLRLRHKGHSAGAPLDENRSGRILAALDLKGSETVVQVGGSDPALAAQLAARLPEGRLIVVDADAAALEAIAALVPAAELLAVDPDTLALERPADAVVVSGLTASGDPERLFKKVRGWLRNGGRFAAHDEEDALITELHACAHGVAAQEPYARYIAVKLEEAALPGAEETESRLLDAGFAFATCRREKLPPQPAPRHPQFADSQTFRELSAQLPEELRVPFERDVAALIRDRPDFSRVHLLVEAVA